MESDLNTYTVGTCMQMCPQTEIEMRENERLLHRLEMLPGTENDKTPKADPKRMVKCFSRSAAGRDLPPPDTIRPGIVLLETVEYLLHDVITVEYIPWVDVYDFIMDRLRAVRQDIVIQNLPKAHCIALLQPIIRFYAYASYRLCEEDINKFDPEINKQHLQECLKRLLVLYNDYDYLELEFAKVNTTNGGFDKFAHPLKNIRPQFEAMYVLFNLGSPEAIHRALKLPKEFRTPVVGNALMISLCYLNGNWIRTVRLIEFLPPLLAAVCALHLPMLRRNALKVMNVAYSSKNLHFSGVLLQRLLLYTNVSHLKEDCQYYNIEYDSNENKIHFLKGTFNTNKPVMKPRHETFFDGLLAKHSVPSLVLYGDV